ncbi:response regulator transcription factor [Thioalkalivibrio sp. ALJ16]|uniref:response regulator transcription factor n=1 Tax=Thioalkalivibrio sp. ALJ16 TaxID=1158762 RepID=UPI00036B2187|nr:response regulator transcription factor [Thioalkalivibrio sp. ALJ16]
MNLRVVLIEDDVALRNQIAEELDRSGCRVDTASDGETGLYLLTEYHCDIAVVDLGLPGMDGLDVIRKARESKPRLPILILTARDRWQDKVEGLEAGGDDYLAKPFHIQELVARLRALARRSLQSGQERLQFGPLVIDTAGDDVWLHGEPVSLTTFEYRLLLTLVRQPGRVLSKEVLADYLYEHDEDRESNVIEVLIGRLRRKLDADGSLGLIETLRGRGYRFARTPDATPDGGGATSG